MATRSKKVASGSVIAPRPSYAAASCSFLFFPRYLTLSTLDLAPHPKNDRTPKTPSSPEAPIELPSNRRHDQPRRIPVLPVAAILGLPRPCWRPVDISFRTPAFRFIFFLFSFSTLSYDTTSRWSNMYINLRKALCRTTDFTTQNTISSLPSPVRLRKPFFPNRLPSLPFDFRP